MLTALAQSADEATGTIPGWVAWLAVVGNFVAIIGGLWGLGKFLRNWILRTVAEPISQVAHTAERANQLAISNQENIKRAHKRIDAVFARIGG